MVSKNNLQHKLEADAKRIPHYSIRKLSVGVCSILLGTTLYFGTSNVAHADITTNNVSETTNIDLNKNNNTLSNTNINDNKVTVTKNTNTNGINNSQQQVSQQQVSQQQVS